MSGYPADYTADEMAVSVASMNGFDARPLDNSSRWCAAIQAVHLLWRNGPIEDFHSGDISDEEVLRANVRATRLVAAAMVPFDRPPGWRAIGEVICDMNRHLGDMSKMRRHARSKARTLEQWTESHGWDWTRVFLASGGSMHAWFGIPWWPQYVDSLEPSETIRAALLTAPDSLDDASLRWVIDAKYDSDHILLRKTWEAAGSPRWAPA